MKECNKKHMNGALFVDGNFLNWKELKRPENGKKYGYKWNKIKDDKIEGGAFYGCEALKELYITKIIKDIDINAIEFCYNLEYINIPMSLYIINFPNFTGFTGCKNLKNINLNIK